MTSQTSDVRGGLSALSALTEYLRSHVFDGSFDEFGIGFGDVARNRARDRLKSIALLMALAPKETVFVTVQNKLKGKDSDPRYGVFAVMEEPDKDDDNMIDLCRPYITQDLYERYVATFLTSSRGRHQHVEIIEYLLLAIHHSWCEMKNLQTNPRCNELCEVFFSYTLGMTFTEYRHRLEFGRQESAFIEFFDGSPPAVETFKLVDASVPMFGGHHLDDWTKLSRNLRDEVNAFEKDLKMTQDELDYDIQEEFTRIQSIPENAYTSLANGRVSTKTIAQVHIIIRFRLRRMLQVLETMEDDTMQSPRQIGTLVDFYKAVTNLTKLLTAYQYFLNKSDPKCECYALPNVFPTKRNSNLSLIEDIQDIQYQKNRTDDDTYDHIRNKPFGTGIMAWLHGLCDHYRSAQNLINFVKKACTSELERSRVIIKFLPKVPEVATEDIDITLVLTSAMEGQLARTGVQEKYDRTAELLAEFSHDDENFGSCVGDGFLSVESLGARFFFAVLDSIVLPIKRKNMEPLSEDMKPLLEDSKKIKKEKKDLYEKKLRKHIGKTYPKIACNRAISMVSAILLDELLIEYYGNVVYREGVPPQHGAVCRLRCWNKISATALPAEVNDDVADRVLAKLQRDVRKRMSSMGVDKLKYWIAFAKGDVDEMPGVEMGEK
ncbi:hypothetical protein EG328_008101 [Venturia inaequalis]|uniref:Uncharacterized protein n=1 Tax=Venturia inaequalis TaxID=5025 RepID=A0A8H3YNM9_VENIN|nr:hypothetical protein EG328_008101 [Venturia inaequalis]KAE9988838.1 hypothetical protein EG327_003201 [Venturia inaequalis]